MKFKIALNEYRPLEPPRVGNVYHVKGGYGSKNKHLLVLIAITESGLHLFLTLDREGNPVGITQYLSHAIEDRFPVGFVEGLEDLTFDIVSI